MKLLYILSLQLLYLTHIVNCYIGSITSNCDVLLDNKTLIYNPNSTYVWLYDNTNITCSCNYTIEYITYASLDIIQIYSSTLASVIIISCLIFSCMLCYIISFWIERRSRNSRRILRFASY